MSNIQESISNLSTDIKHVRKNMRRKPPNKQVMSAIASLRLINNQGTTHIINYYEDRIDNYKDKLITALEEVERQKKELKKIKRELNRIGKIKGIGSKTIKKINNHMNL